MPHFEPGDRVRVDCLLNMEAIVIDTTDEDRIGVAQSEDDMYVMYVEPKHLTNLTERDE